MKIIRKDFQTKEKFTVFTEPLSETEKLEFGLHQRVKKEKAEKEKRMETMKKELKGRRKLY